MSSKGGKKARSLLQPLRYPVTRPNFSIALPGRVYAVSNVNPTGTWYTTTDSNRCDENATGVSRRKPEGFVPPTGYYFKRREYRRAYGRYERRASATVYSIRDGYIGGNLNGVSGIHNSLNRWDDTLTEDSALSRLDTSAAITAARLKIKQKRVDLGVAFAERRQTSRMLGDTAIRLANSFNALKRGNFRDAARHLGVLAPKKRPRGSNVTSHWLELQYGWKPLLSDVYGAVDALSKRPPGDWRVTAKALRKDVTEYSKIVPPGTTIGTTISPWQGSAVRNRGVFVRIDAVPTNDLTMSLASLGVTNPLLVVWETVPYSFVVDWAFPIGNWLDSLDALLGYEDIWTSVTTRNEGYWEEWGLQAYFKPTEYVKTDYKGTKRVLEINRTASSGAPLGTFPVFKDPRSLGHMANGLSLLAQAFGRK